MCRFIKLQTNKEVLLIYLLLFYYHEYDIVNKRGRMPFIVGIIYSVEKSDHS